MELLLVVHVSGEGVGFPLGRLSCVAVVPDRSARCIASAHSPLATILKHSALCNSSAHGLWS